MTDNDRILPKIELLPCPFCGCDKVVIFYDHPNSVGEFLAGYYISHPVWKEYPEAWGCRLNFGGKFETEQEAAKEWNTRAALQPQDKANG